MSYAVTTDSQHLLWGEEDTEAQWDRDWPKAMGEVAAELDKGTGPPTFQPQAGSGK